ncbi:MAG TPA: 2-C-methyl-D-erythritol 2,4-cyclodiphosphate synthase [bacterium]|nr:2-C-methyl-D-erythritol 2,4-cyclodiphosphate synthase [bacterium]
MRIGTGFDIHVFEKGTKLMLAGIEIPYPMGLKGHSDGDVVLHAISDAIAGALAIDDIGTEFPDTNTLLKGIKSSFILSHYTEKIQQHDAKIVNVDIILLAEKPLLKSWYNPMKKHIAELLNIEPSQVGIKAKTMEHLGQIGKGKAMACLASILIDVPSS